MTTLTITRQPNIISNVKEKLANWKQLPFKQKLLSIIKNKTAKYTIAGVVAAGGTYGATELLQNFQQNNTPNNIGVVVNDDNKEELDNDTANYNDYVNEEKTSKKDFSENLDGDPPIKIGSISFDKNYNIIEEKNSHLSANDVKWFNAIPKGDELKTETIKLLEDINADKSLSDTDKAQLEYYAIYLAGVTLNTQKGEIDKKTLSIWFGDIKQSWGNYSGNSKSVATSWENITVLVQAVANPKIAETIEVIEVEDDFEFDFGDDIIDNEITIADLENQEKKNKNKLNTIENQETNKIENKTVIENQETNKIENKTVIENNENILKTDKTVIENNENDIVKQRAENEKLKKELEGKKGE